MPNRHRFHPIPFRPAEGDRAWLAEYAKQTGQPVNAILRAALTAYRENVTRVILLTGGNAPEA